MNSDASPDEVASVQPSGIDLYWLPLGAGGHSVRLNGLVFEAIAARLQHRDRSDLYHSALEVHVPEGRFVIEQAPAWGESGERSLLATARRRRPLRPHERPRLRGDRGAPAASRPLRRRGRSGG